jgi:muconolactone delta-isomerase
MQFFVHLGVRERSVSRDVLTAELVSHEIKEVKDLLTSGTVLQAWKREDCHCVVLLLEVLSDPACRAVLARLPFSKAGVLDIQLIVPVEPFLDVYSDQAPE